MDADRRSNSKYNTSSNDDLSVDILSEINDEKLVFTIFSQSLMTSLWYSTFYYFLQNLRIKGCEIS